MKKLLLTLIMAMGVLSFVHLSWAVDPNVNTQSTDVRSDGSNGNPGFNPCLGGTRDANGVCGGAVNAAALLSPANLTMFTTLGPGAVTDNMFGIIEQDATPGTCGTGAVGSNDLNCGDARFNPSQQGQSSLTAADNSLTTTAPVDMNNTLSADFCANAGTDCQDSVPAQVTAAHTGFNVVNNFSWDQLSTTTAAVVSSQTMEQVTALKTTGIGTFAAPGSGDQRVLLTTAFTTTSSNNPATGGAATVTWTSLIEDPDQSGTGTGKFTQTLSGSFVYNGSVSFPAVQYPNGQSQTNGVTTATLP